MRYLVTLLLVTACGATPEHPVKQPPPSPPTAADAAVMSRAPVSNEGVLHRVCGRPSYDAETMFDATSPGITCRRKADCGTDPLMHCFGWIDGCDAAAADSCMIRTTLCRKDDCADDSDCPADTRCVCPAAGHDPWCIADGCDDDSDCAEGQRCRDDDAIRGIGPVQHCTTPNDVCSDSSECTDPNNACGYDTSVRHWLCTSILTVD